MASLHRSRCESRAAPRQSASCSFGAGMALADRSPSAADRRAPALFLRFASRNSSQDLLAHRISLSDSFLTLMAVEREQAPRSFVLERVSTRWRFEWNGTNAKRESPGRAVLRPPKRGKRFNMARQASERNSRPCLSSSSMTFWGGGVACASCFFLRRSASAASAMQLDSLRLGSARLSNGNLTQFSLFFCRRPETSAVQVPLTQFDR